jgi:hypothetical protein
VPWVTARIFNISDPRPFLISGSILKSASGPLNLFPLARTYYRLGIIGLNLLKQRIRASVSSPGALFSFGGPEPQLIHHTAVVTGSP